MIILKNIENFYRRLVFSGILLVLFQFAPSLIAEANGVPPGIQITMISRLLRSNTRLASKSSVNMLIVYNSKTELLKNMLCQEIKPSSRINYFTDTELNLNHRNIDVVYFMPGSEGSSSICKKYKILSIASSAKAVQSGQVSVAVVIVNTQPRVFVSLSSLQAEDQHLTNEMLRVANVSP